MKRFRPVGLCVASTVALAVYLIPAGGAAAGAGKLNFLGYQEPLCTSHASLCADPADNPNGEYVGHDEPSIEFKSGVRGSGHDVTYLMTLPRDPKAFPNASGAGGTTWNFELRPTFWFGLTLCDTESSPEFTKTCTPDSDANDLVGTNPKSTDYIGKHPGNAYMELQFYGPGYVPQFEGFGCTATQYCAAMTIDSRTLDQNNGVENTAACDNYVLGGPEPINWAYITRSGHSQAPANPLFTGTFAQPDFSAVNPDTTKDLMMNPGDRMLIHMHDTRAGFRIDLVDQTTGQSGSMTASIANGFGHILYTPHSSTCRRRRTRSTPSTPTANPRGNTWSAHTYNIAMSDEIGHFENCLAIDANFNCSTARQSGPACSTRTMGTASASPGPTRRWSTSTGASAPTPDWDGQSYQQRLAGHRSQPRPGQEAAPDARSVHEPADERKARTTRRSRSRRTCRGIEASDSQDNPPFCDRTTGANCVNPPNGAAFYPFFTTTQNQGTCTWQEGGNSIPGTINHFGGSSTTEFGPLLQTVYPEPGFTTALLYNNFNSGDTPNPCPVR